MGAQTEKHTDDGSRIIRWWIAVTVTLSVLMGVYGFFHYRSIERGLTPILTTMRSTGKTASPDQCIDKVMDWRKGCHAMEGLCSAYVPRAMGACLESQDRTSFCKSLKTNPTTTHFGFGDCKKKVTTRKMKKACAAAYRMIEAHCRRLLGENYHRTTKNNHRPR